MEYFTIVMFTNKSRSCSFQDMAEQSSKQYLG